MKNVLILTAMFLSSAASAVAVSQGGTTVTQPVNATVQNTCIAIMGNDDLATNPGVKAEASGNQGNSVIDTINYKANANSNTVNTHSNGKASSPDGGLYAFRCTSGTNFTAQVGDDVVTQNFTGKITLTSSDSPVGLIADYKITRIDIADGSTGVGSAGATYGAFTGDVHAADAEFSVAAGQWSAKASTKYTGNLVVNVTFN